MEIYIPGSETRFAQTCRPCAEYKSPYIALLNYNKTLKDAKTITKHPSPANPNVGKLIYTTGIEVHPCTSKHSPITSCNVRNRSNYK